MIDVSHPLRKSYYELLNNQLNTGGNPVPVGDETKKFDLSEEIYVILSTQTDTEIHIASVFDSWHEITIDIVAKASTRVNKNTVDDIAGQIMNLVMPAPGVNGLPIQAGTQFLCVQKSRDYTMPAMLNNVNTVLRRILTFKQYIRQSGSSTVPSQGSVEAAFPPWILITSSDFANDTDYINQDLYGLTIGVQDNDVPGKWLDEGTQWNYISVLDSSQVGGIRILIPGFDISQFHEFILFLK